MNERQIIAYHNPCYTPADLKNPELERKLTYGRLRLRTALKVMGFLANEMWTATVFAGDERGQMLGKKDLSKEEQEAIRKILESLLEGVGKEKLSFFEDESEFEAMRFLTAREVKNLPKMDLNALLDIKNRQGFALRNAAPTVEVMLLKRFTSLIDCGGFLFSTGLTVKKMPDGYFWHSSSCVIDEHQNPLLVFTLPVGAGEMNMKFAVRLLDDIGTGQISMPRSDRETRIISMFRKLSEKEEKNLILLKGLDPIKNELSVFLKNNFN